MEIKQGLCRITIYKQVENELRWNLFTEFEGKISGYPTSADVQNLYTINRIPSPKNSLDLLLIQQNEVTTLYVLNPDFKVSNIPDRLKKYMKWHLL